MSKIYSDSRKYTNRSPDFELTGDEATEQRTRNAVFSRVAGEHTSGTELQRLHSDNRELKQQLGMLAAKNQVVTEEKALHIEAHANEKIAWENEKKKLVDGYTRQRAKMKKDFGELMDLIEQVKVTCKGMGDATAKGPINKERQYKQKLVEKERKIKELENKLTDTHCNQHGHRSQPTIKLQKPIYTSIHSPANAQKSFGQLESLISKLERKEKTLRKKMKVLDSTLHEPKPQTKRKTYHKYLEF